MRSPTHDRLYIDIEGLTLIQYGQLKSALIETICWPPGFGLDHGVGHPMPFGLPHGSPRWTEGHWEYLDCLENRGKHRAGLLPKNRSVAVVRSLRVRRKL